MLSWEACGFIVFVQVFLEKLHFTHKAGSFISGLKSHFVFACFHSLETVVYQRIGHL